MENSTLLTLSPAQFLIRKKTTQHKVLQSDSFAFTGSNTCCLSLRSSMHRQVILHLLLKSHNYYYIKNALLHLSKLIQEWNIFVINFKLIPLPKKQQKITVLKSPHVHKKAREQFELLKKKSVVQIETNSKQQVRLILLLLNYSQFPGVQVKCHVRYLTSL